MSKKIIERRNASANVPEKNRAEIVKAEHAKKRPFIRWIIFGVIVALAVAALVFVIINSIISNIASNISPNGSYKDTVPTIAESFKDTSAFYGDVSLLKNYAAYALTASNNHSANVNYIKDDENIFNYAIYGVENSNPDAPSADVIIIASINKETNKLTYVLMDADALVYIPYANVVGPLKHAYNFGGGSVGGSNLLSRTISQNFGVDIDGYVEMKMDGAVSLVDELGGIQLAMSDEEVTKLNAAIAAYNVRFELTGDNAVPAVTKDTNGNVNLEGAQAVAYIRGVSANRETAIFKILASVTKTAIKDGFSGINKLSKAFAESATTSTEKDDFTTVLKLAVNATGEAVADSMNTVTLSKDAKKLVNLGKGAICLVYSDYEDTVDQLRSAIYGK